MSTPDRPNPDPPSSAAEKIRNTTAGQRVCPYCGQVGSDAATTREPCNRCGMEDTPGTRTATAARVGPWYVLQVRNPASPGMNFATLQALVRKGQVTPSSVVRGPTTQQLWTFAARVKGVSKEFGVCYACGGQLEGSSNLCPHCQRLQDPPINPDALLESKPAGAPRPRAAAAAAIEEPEARPEVGLPARGRSRILTPQELAAAFALSGPGEVEEKPVAAPTPRPRPRRSPVRRAVWVMAVLAGVGTGGYLAHDPKAWAETKERFGRAGEWGRAHWSRGVEWVRGLRSSEGAATEGGVDHTGSENDLRGEGTRPASGAAQWGGWNEPNRYRTEGGGPVPQAAADREAEVAPARKVPASMPSTEPSKPAVSELLDEGGWVNSLRGGGDGWAYGPTAKRSFQDRSGDAQRVALRLAGVGCDTTSERGGRDEAGWYEMEGGEPTPEAAVVSVAEVASARIKPASLPATEPSKAAVTAVTEPVATPEQVARAGALYRQALEAESEEDYAGAVRLYEKIREMPHGAWPGALERKLAAARKRGGS